jgi:sugar lactone lactonase YvrE
MPTIAIRSNDVLGESPFWNSEDNTLWRVDIKEKKIYKWSQVSNKSIIWEVPSEIGCFIPSKNSEQGLAALEDGIYIFDLITKKLKLITNPKENTNKTRFNDGKIDRYGNFWIGSMDKNEKESIGCLFVLDAHLNLKPVLKGLTISNGLGWSPNNKVMYVTDSGVKTIWAFDYDPEKLVLSNRRVFSKDIDYYPDGLAVDKNGCVWSAKWDGGCIVKYSPDGKVEKIIDLPIKRPTSIVFGGKDFKSLFITSACLGLDIQNNHSLNGSILEVDSGTNGAQERMFSL